MASVVKDPRGFKRVQWSLGDGERRTLRLGIASVRQAEAVKVRIEQLLAAQATGVLDAEAIRWVESLDDPMHKKLSHLGLVKPRDRHVAMLGQLLDNYFATLHVKVGTKRTYEQTRAGLESHFGTVCALEAITPLDCDKWRQAMRDAKLADATVAKRVKTARQIFKQAIRWKLLSENPLADVKGGGSINRDRMRFISTEDIQKVLDACPDAEWRLIVCLARYGGVRIPSEIMPLVWSDIDFEKGLIHITSCKTEGYAGKDRRTIPMFPQLRKALMEVFETAAAGSELVIATHRLRSANLRTQMHRIIKRAGLTPWPKPFHNLRSSRQTELSQRHPMHVVCAWLGNSPTVALGHYLQVRDTDYAAAIAADGPAVVNAADVAATNGRDGSGGVAGAVVTGRDLGQRGGEGANVAA